MIRSTPASLPTYTPSLRHAGLPDYLASAFITQPEKSRGLTTRHAEYLLQRWANQFRRQSALDALKVRDPDLSAVFVPFRLEREGLPA